MRLYISFALLFLLINVSLEQAVVCDPLKEVMESEEYKELTKEPNDRTRRESIEKLVDPNSNYGRLLLESGKGSELSEWIKPSKTSFKKISGEVKRNRQFLMVNHVYETKSGAKLILNVFVPNPQYLSMVQYGLINEFSDIVPPKLPVLSSESITVHGLPGELYHQREGGCSIVLRLIKETYVQFVTQSCKDIADLARLGEELDLQNLNNRLNS